MIHKGRCFGVVDDVTGRYKKKQRLGLLFHSRFLYQEEQNPIHHEETVRRSRRSFAAGFPSHITGQFDPCLLFLFCFFILSPTSSTVANGICLRMKRCNGADELNVQLGIEVKTLCLACIYDLVILGEKS